MNEKRPSDWDWVSERFKCSIPLMFEQLRSMAERDVQIRNGLVGGERFRLQMSDDVDVREVHFLVVGPSSRNVEFARDQTRIIVRHRTAGAVQAKFEMTLTLTDEAGCKFKVEGVDLETWQVMKRALEWLFFD